MSRVIKNTILRLTRPDGLKLSFGEGCDFEIYHISGLGIGEIEKETVPNALADGEQWLGSRVVNRVVEIESAWNNAGQRNAFTAFFQHGARFEVELLFNNSRYYGSCVLHEKYDIETHGGNLYSGSGIALSLYFDDPYLYTGTVYNYEIGRGTSFNTMFYNQPDEHEIAVPPGDGFIHTFGIFSSAQEHIINNPSSTPNGIEATIRASGLVLNPKIVNATTGVFTQLNLSMQADDVLYLNTQMGFIKARLNGADVLRFLTLPSRMIQLQSGENRLLFAPDEGAGEATCAITFRGKVAAI